MLFLVMSLRPVFPSSFSHSFISPDFYTSTTLFPSLPPPPPSPHHHRLPTKHLPALSLSSPLPFPSPPLPSHPPSLRCIIQSPGSTPITWALITPSPVLKPASKASVWTISPLAVCLFVYACICILSLCLVCVF